MKVDAQNSLWETAAGLLGLVVAEVSSRLRRRNNRIEGSLDGSQVSVSYARHVSGIVVSVTVRDEGEEGTDEYLLPVEILVPGDVKESSDVVGATSQAVAAVHAAVPLILSAPEATRSTSSFVTGEFSEGSLFSDDSPLLAILRDLGTLVPGEGLVVADTSNDEVFMQAARGESGYRVEYRDGDAGSHYVTETDNVSSALSLFVLWMANDPAWRTAAEWKPADL